MTVREVAALSMALSGTVEYDEGNAIPQAVWDSLYARKLIVLTHDVAGEGYTRLSAEGSAALVAALR